jgi:hypothetical protein
MEMQRDPSVEQDGREERVMALTKDQWKDRAFAMERERDQARAERDEALESSRRWEAEVMLYAANRDYQRGKRVEAEAQVNDLAAALRQLERIATAVAGDESTEARYGSLWSDLRKAAAEARKVLDKHDGKTERNES